MLKYLLCVHADLRYSNIPHTCFLSPTHNSEGVIAYYWSQFDIPVEDLEILPEFSEERVLDTLERALAKRSMQGSVRILEITASRRYPLWGQVGGLQVAQSPQGALASTIALAPDPDI